MIFIPVSAGELLNQLSLWNVAINNFDDNLDPKEAAMVEDIVNSYLVPQIGEDSVLFFLSELVTINCDIRRCLENDDDLDASRHLAKRNEIITRINNETNSQFDLGIYY